jgi:hypothetical protein
MSDYNFAALGWYQFERLCQALLRAGHGALLEAWGGNRDLGRDAYSPGPLRFPDPSRLENGPFVFQVKYVNDARIIGGENAAKALTSAVTLEATRIAERIEKGVWVHPRHYAVFTNVALTPSARTKVARLLAPVLHGAQLSLSGESEISAMLDQYPEIRVSYPQVLGLRDLQQLLAAVVAGDVIERSRFSVRAAADLTPVFVPTAAYNRTLRILEKNGFVVLLGPPEMGKTVLAQMLALAKHTTGWDVVECRHPSDVFRVFDRKRQQVFLADDAFGSTEYRPEIAMDWAADLPRLMDLVDENHWLIWTSRPAPLQEGLRQLHLQGSARHFPSPGEIQIEASDLSIEEKAQMLYRHAKNAALAPEGIAYVRRSARFIVESPHFTPLRIARFVQEQLPKLLCTPEEDRWNRLRESVSQAIRATTSDMSTSFGTLDEERRAALVVLLNYATGDATIEGLGSQLEKYLGHPLTTSGESIVQSIEGHFVRVGDPRRW